MKNFIKSLLLRWDIEVLRYIDQKKRKVTGLPTVSTSQITPNLFVGGQYKLTVFEHLKELGITAIVNMRQSTVHANDGSDIGVRYLHLPTRDYTAPSVENLIKGVKFIKQEIDNGGKVYIHCKSGEGRGPIMAAAYLIYSGLTFDDALATIKKVRKFIRPNFLQLKGLRRYEKLSKNT